MTNQTDIIDAVRQCRDRFRQVGYVLIALGVLAILFPLVFSIAAKAVLGWVFMLTGAALLYHAFQAKGWPSAIWSGLIAVMHLALGVYLGFFALTGLVGLTALMGIVFLFQGAFEAVMAAQHRPQKGWGWLALNGAATIDHWGSIDCWSAGHCVLDDWIVLRAEFLNDRHRVCGAVTGRLS